MLNYFRNSNIEYFVFSICVLLTRWKILIDNKLNFLPHLPSTLL